MNRLAVIALLLTACGGSETPPASAQTAAPPEVGHEQVTATGPSVKRAPPPPFVAPDPTLPALSVVSLRPEQGSLSELLVSESAKARSKGRRAFVELSAGWCPRCKKLNGSLKHGGGKAAAAGVHLIVLDTDAWGSRLDREGFTAQTIPALYELDKRGKPTGRTLNGHGWKKHTDAQIAGSLGAFFHPRAEG